MEHSHKNHKLVRYDFHKARARYHCRSCNMFFSFTKNFKNGNPYISNVKNFKKCFMLTDIFINLSCEEIQIKNLLE